MKQLCYLSAMAADSSQ